MKVIRLAGLMLMAILAMSLMAASAASAGLYLFSTGSVGTLWLGLSLASRLASGKNEVLCTDDHNEGKILNVHLLGPFDITFLGCESTKNGKEFCKANSVGAPAGVILTKTLHALLGVTLPGNLAGLLVLPTASPVFTEIEENKCTVGTSPEGTVAGLLLGQQLGHGVTETLVVFVPGDPKLIDTLNGLVKPKLLSFGAESTFETVEHLVWDGEVEVEV